MLAMLAAVMGAGAAVPPPPPSMSIVSNTNAISSSGTCLIHEQQPDTGAQIDVTITLANIDWTKYKLNVVRNNSLVQTVTSGTSPVDWTYTPGPGLWVSAAEPNHDGAGSTLNVNDTYRADLVRLSDNAVVDTKTSTRVTTLYKCKL